MIGRRENLDLGGPDLALSSGAQRKKARVLWVHNLFLKSTVQYSRVNMII